MDNQESTKDRLTTAMSQLIHQKEASRFESPDRLKPFCVESACSAYASLGSPCVIWLLPTLLRLDSKLNCDRSYSLYQPCDKLANCPLYTPLFSL